MDGMEGERRWEITLYSNPQLLSLLGQGWTYASLLRVNTLSSRRIKVSVRPADTVLSVKRGLEDSTGVPVETQELRKVNMDGATESTLADSATMQESGVVAGTTLFWVTSADGDIGLFATDNADGCKMARSTGSETVTVSAEQGQEEDTSNWWERSGSSSGVLAGSPRRQQPVWGVDTDTTRHSFSGTAGATLANGSTAAENPAAEAERRKAALLAAESRAATEAATEAAAAAAAPPSEPQPWLPNGRRVRITGLQNPKAAHLNDKHATVTGHLEDLDRYVLHLDGGAGQAKIKRANVVALAAPKPASKRQIAQRRATHQGGGTAVDPAAEKEAMMKEAREARQRGRTGHEHESVGLLLLGAGGADGVQPVDAEAMMRQMRQERGLR